MKYRLGFVSNSSSASFLIAFPKDNPIALKDMEDWLGGYTTELAPEIMEIIGFQFWKTQYFDEEMYRRDFSSNGHEYDFHYCNAAWNQKEDIFFCPKYMNKDENGEPIDYNCEKCKYHIVEKRIDRGDDYYQALDQIYGESALTWLERHKDDKIVYFEVDDNNPARGLDYTIACEITSNAEILFNHKTDNVYCLGGK